MPNVVVRIERSISGGIPKYNITCPCCPDYKESAWQHWVAMVAAGIHARQECSVWLKSPSRQG